MRGSFGVQHHAPDRFVSVPLERNTLLGLDPRALASDGIFCPNLKIGVCVCVYLVYFLSTLVYFGCLKIFRMSRNYDCYRVTLVVCDLVGLT